MTRRAWIPWILCAAVNGSLHQTQSCIPDHRVGQSSTIRCQSECTASKGGTPRSPVCISWRHDNGCYLLRCQKTLTLYQTTPVLSNGATPDSSGQQSSILAYVLGTLIQQSASFETEVRVLLIRTTSSWQPASTPVSSTCEADKASAVASPRQQHSSRWGLNPEFVLHKHHPVNKDISRNKQTALEGTRCRHAS